MKKQTQKNSLTEPTVLTEIEKQSQLSFDFESSSQRKQPQFSSYIVYVDESGDSSLEKIDKGYPVFVLAFCVFHKRYYAEQLVPEVQGLKFNYFGHDMIILHEKEIRKKEPPFSFRTKEIEKGGRFEAVAGFLPSAKASVITPATAFVIPCLSSMVRILKNGQKKKALLLVESKGR